MVTIFDEVMLKERRRELELYKKTAKDEEFKHGMLDTLKRLLEVLGESPDSTSLTTAMSQKGSFHPSFP